MKKHESIDASRLTERITIQKYDGSQNNAGQFFGGNYSDWVTTWAEVKCYRSSVADAEGMTQGEMLYNVYIRWRDGITSDMRVKWHGKTLELVGPPVDWVSRRVGLTLLCRELVTAPDGGSHDET